MPPIQEFALVFSIGAKLYTAIRRTAQALREDSPGGKRITKKERKAIIAALIPVIERIVDEVDESDAEAEGPEWTAPRQAG